MPGVGGASERRATAMYAACCGVIVMTGAAAGPASIVWITAPSGTANPAGMLGGAGHWPPAPTQLSYAAMRVSYTLSRLSYASDSRLALSKKSGSGARRIEFEPEGVSPPRWGRARVLDERLAPRSASLVQVRARTPVPSPSRSLSGGSFGFASAAPGANRSTIKNPASVEKISLCTISPHSAKCSRLANPSPCGAPGKWRQRSSLVPTLSSPVRPGHDFRPHTS